MAEKSLQNARQELKRHVLGLTDDECRILLEMIKISKEGIEKTPEECFKLAAKRLGITLRGSKAENDNEDRV